MRWIGYLPTVPVPLCSARFAVSFTPRSLVRVRRPCVQRGRGDRATHAVHGRGAVRADRGRRGGADVRRGAVLERVHDLGNVNAVLRSAEGLGYGAAHLVDLQGDAAAWAEALEEEELGIADDGSVEGGMGRARRQSQGADKWIDLRLWPDAERGVRRAPRAGLPHRRHAPRRRRRAHRRGRLLGPDGARLRQRARRDLARPPRPRRPQRRAPHRRVHPELQHLGRRRARALPRAAGPDRPARPPRRSLGGGAGSRSPRATISAR